MLTANEKRFGAFITKTLLVIGAVTILFMPNFEAEEIQYDMPDGLIALMEAD